MQYLIKTIKVSGLAILFLLLVGNAKAQTGIIAAIPRNGSLTVNGITVSSTSTGSVADAQNTRLFCGYSLGYQSFLVGSYASSSWSWTMTFSQPVNNLLFDIVGTDAGENFVFDTNGGTTSIFNHATGAGTGCNMTISGNTVSSDGGGNGAGEFRITSTNAFSSITISGLGGGGGSHIAISEYSIVPARTCNAGIPAPILSASSISNICPATTVNLNTITASNTPSGAVLTWHGSPGVSNSSRISNPSSGVMGVSYYAAFYDATNDCYSGIGYSAGTPYSWGSTSVSAYVYNNCCSAGNTAPNLSATTISNVCPATTVNLSGITASNTPSGASLSWHSGTPATTANKLTSVTSLAAGTYYASFYDAANNCYTGSAVTAVSATVNSCCNLSLSTSNSPVSCNGGSNGSASVSASGGTGAYSYLWSNGATTLNITGMPAGTYNVTVTDAVGCSRNTSAQINQPSIISLSASSNPVSCNGGSNGSASVSVTGGTGAYSYLWNNGVAASNITGMPAGTYTVTVTDANGCAKSTSAQINQPTAISINPSSIPVKCKGENNGSASTNVTGGTGAYTYLWSNSASTPNITGLSAGTYSLTVTDANACTKNTSVIVAESSTALTASSSNTAISCNGGSNGTATISPSGGTSPYTYLWSNGATTQSITGLGLGTYSATVTDAYGCIINGSAQQITQPSVISLSASNSPVKCKGGSDGSASVSATGGTGVYSYFWSNSATSSNITGMPAGTYSVTVTDANGCTKNTSATISEPNEPLSATFEANAVKCKGGNNGSASIFPTGGTGSYSYLWSNGGISFNNANLIAGTYNVTVKDVNNCTFSRSVVVSEPNLDLTFSFTKEDVKCFDGQDGKVILNVVGGTSPYTALYNNTESINLTVSSLKAGSYILKVKDANNCLSPTSSVSITQPQPINISFLSELTPRGYQTPDGKIAVNIEGGTVTSGQYKTNWFLEGNNVGDGRQEVLSGKVQNTIEKVPGGNFKLIAYDDNYASSTTNTGCKAEFSYFLKQPDKIVIQNIVNKSISCFGKFDGQITANVTGGVQFENGNPYQYKWFKKENGSLTDLNITTDVLSNVDAGFYTVKIVDKNDITDEKEIELKVTPSLSSKIVNLVNPSCPTSKNGLIEISPIGAVEPFTVTWSKSLTGAKIENLGVGSYFGIIKDKNGCFGEVALELKPQEDIKIDMVNKKSLICLERCDGEIDINVSASSPNYTIRWSNGASNVKKLTQLCAGTYSVSAVSNSGCTAALNNINLGSPEPFKVEVANDMSICSDSNIEIDASKSIKTTNYKWTLPNGTTSSNPLVSVRAAGTYKIEVENQAGCKASDVFNVRVANTVSGLNFAVSSKGSINQYVYAINLSPNSINSTWKVTGSADIIQNTKEILIIVPKADGEIKVELLAKLGDCETSMAKKIVISGLASTVLNPQVFDEEQYLVYPNPNDGRFMIQTPNQVQTDDVEISIFDANLNRLLYSNKNIDKSQYKIELDLSDQTEGIIHVVISKNGKRISKKVIIQK